VSGHVVCASLQLLHCFEAQCIYPYVQATTGQCVNILTDVNNCGTLKNMCPSNYSSCSAGQCSTMPSILSTNGTTIWSASINGSTDDASYNINLPFNITLYGTASGSLTVTTNGVSTRVFQLFLLPEVRKYYCSIS
jgi:hypothetical protein